MMVLPNALLLPNTLLPLRIFEERYREMLAHSLAHHRMFCVALMKPKSTEAESMKDVFGVAGLGLVRASVTHDDGTSHLILQGLARVELLDLVQTEPFWIAAIREKKSKLSNLVESEALAAKVLELCEKLPGPNVPEILKKQLPHLANPEIIADVVTGAFVQDPFQRQWLL
ncbi:MAG: ATP-dependent Lon protease, partial [Chthoniobacter sp.]|nr:ATP-dependent Lon protease [Chthoniobacter sp.]